MRLYIVQVELKWIKKNSITCCRNEPRKKSFYEAKMGKICTSFLIMDVKHTFINQSITLQRSQSCCFSVSWWVLRCGVIESLCQWECLEGGVLSVYWGGVIIFYVDWSVWGRGRSFYVCLGGLRGGVLLILMSTEVISGGGVINFLCQLECFGRGG